MRFQKWSQQLFQNICTKNGCNTLIPNMGPTHGYHPWIPYMGLKQPQILSQKYVPNMKLKIMSTLKNYSKSIESRQPDYRVCTAQTLSKQLVYLNCFMSVKATVAYYTCF